MKQYLLLILYQTYADLRAEAKRTYAGFLWWFAEPLLHMVIYYLVFAVILQRGTADFVPFLLIGLVAWRWFHVSLMQGGMSILNGRRVMQQIYLPKTIFPSVNLLVNAVKFSITLIILLLFLWVYGLLPTAYYLALPLVLATQMLLIMGAVYVCAAVMPFLPDLRILIDNGLRALMFVSGIFFAGNTVPEHLQVYFYLNPMAVIIEAYRNVLMGGHWPHWEGLAYVAMVGVMGILIGRKLIARYDYSYPKVMGG